MSTPHAIVISATADLGKASGLEAAVKVLRAMANHNRRVVGTNEIKDVAQQLEDTAAEIRAKANEALRPFTRSNVA